MSVSDLRRRRGGLVRPSPFFLAFVALAAFGAALAWVETDRGSRVGDLGVFVFVLAGWVVSVCLHEFAHAYAAFRAGDRSVEARGYLTLNPFKYAHPVLSLLLPLFFIVQGGIGLPGGAVYLHPHTFRSRRARSLAAAVGPLTNVVFAAALLILAGPHLSDIVGYLQVGASSDQHVRFWCAIAFLGFLQVTAAVLNLLPVPGLDGYAIIEPYLDPDTVTFGNKIKPWGMIGVIVLLMFQQLNVLFFRGVYSIYDLFGADRLLAQAGREFFRWWGKFPL